MNFVNNKTRGGLSQTNSNMGFFGSSGFLQSGTSAHLKLLFVLILSWNLSSTSSFCPPYCLCDDTALTVNCHHSSSNLRVVPIFLNPQIKSLTLAKNQIKDITLSLQFYAELQSLDISQNALDTLGKQNFELLKSLRLLNVSYNGIKALENGVFAGLRSTQVIDLTGNQIERTEREIFWYLKSLREIILDRNRLEFLDWDLFRGLDTLERISVKFNFIQVIEPSPSLVPTPEGLPPWTLKSLKVLDVSSNQLTRVKDNSLVIFGSLKDLNLCCNYIHTLEPNAFTSGQVEKVNLSQNRLGQVPSEALDRLGLSLRDLDLSSNRISDQLGKNAFKALFKLENLRVSDNPGVLSIDPDALGENVNLVRFEADYLSNLTELSPNLLNNKPNLEHFSVKYAQISILSPELVETPLAPGVGSLDLTGNPIECNCSVYPLFQYLRDHGDEVEMNSVVMEEEVDLDLRRKSSLEDGNSNNFSKESQAQYVHPNSGNSEIEPEDGNNWLRRGGQNKKPQPPVHLFTLRCQSPTGLKGIPVKDLKNTDFEDCFAGEDHFQILVICIAGTILSLIFLVIGMKLCCSYQSSSSSGCGSRRMSTFCKNCCHLRSSKKKDKADKLYDSMIGLRRDLPPLSSNNSGGISGGNYNTTSTNCATLPNGNKLIMSDHNSPSHLFFSNNMGLTSTGPGTLINSNSHNFNTSNNTNSHSNRIPLGLDYSSSGNNGSNSINGYHGYHTHTNDYHQQLPLHNLTNTLGSSTSSSGQSGSGSASGGKAAKYHQHPSSNYPAYPPPPLPTSNPPVILHYEYQYPDYPGSSHRGVKQVPSVLV